MTWPKIKLPPMPSDPVLMAVAGGCALCVLLVVWWTLIGGPAHDRKAAAAARVDATFSDARAGAAQDAAGVVTQSATHEAQIEAQTRENSIAIHQAPGASAPVDPGVDLAGRRAICLRDANRHKPACRQLLDARP